MPDVTVFEESVGFRFPHEFREFAVHPLGGLYKAVKKELWPRGRAYEVGPFLSFLYGLMVYGFSPQAPDWLQMSIAWRRMSDDGYPQFVPFLKIIGDPDPYCFTRDEKIVIWRHENPGEVEVVAKSFSQLLIFEIRELEERKKRKLNRRSDHMRRQLAKPDYTKNASLTPRKWRTRESLRRLPAILSATARVYFRVVLRVFAVPPDSHI